MFNMLGIDTRYVLGVLPLLGFAIGHYLDKKETERMTMFRDKSALYSSKTPREEPSW